MAYPIKRVLETRIIHAATAEELNTKLLEFQKDNRLANAHHNGGVWEPFQALSSHVIVMNRVKVDTFGD